ncbi:MAG: 50S ribosomal protein L32 [Candidatus Glassbacteria bacterium]|nr:50S ribosomal protein L32 [Candidatus Glassbacteria bacterium]
MAVPKRKTSKSRKRKRRTHFKIDSPAASTCSNCGQVKQPHRVCPHCGHYKNREVIEVVE